MAKANATKLVIVESPAKAKTIHKYLGKGYVVRASMGHVRDLPSRGMGVDLESFQPQYDVLPSRAKVIKELRQIARSSDEVFLATDLDREGEAIAWHLKEALDIPDKKARRVIFNAITKSEIQKAFAHPMRIDMDRVNAQQARRILDRVVGYEISPLLWRKVARGLSAGRVQSVAVRLIVEREREIEAFVPAEHWKIAAIFTTDGRAAGSLGEQWRGFRRSAPEATKAEVDAWLSERGLFAAELIEIGGARFEASDKRRAVEAARRLGFVLERDDTVEDPEAKGPARYVTTLSGRVDKAPDFAVRSVEKKRVTSRPPAPFITSTLQQAASSRLSFGAQKTMRTAQDLYEAGHITYMRTDSTHLSPEALGMVRDYIAKHFGDRYLPASANVYASSNKAAQEAHEAIRPTDTALTPAEARSRLAPDQHRLYQLIWNRFVACQMTPAEFDQTTVTIVTPASAAGGGEAAAVLRAGGRKLAFDGFMRVAGVSSEDQLLPDLREKTALFPVHVDPSQHFSQPPPRYSEASLVKELEKLGIGRPSTYASIIQTIQDRQYVQQINRRFHATMLGKIVTDKLIQAFPEIMDVKFTADMETQLDRIEEAHLDWVKLLREFYGPFHKTVDEALEKVSHAGGTPSDHKCEKCGRPMVYRISKNGFFLSCTGYPDCDGTRAVDPMGNPTLREVSEHRCPNCGREMVKRRGRFGEFLGCAGYPECKTLINLDKEGNPLPPKPKPVPTDFKCEKCGSPMLLRDSKRGPFLGCSSFPKCRAIRSVKKLSPDEAARLEAFMPLLGAEKAATAELMARIAPQTVPAALASGPVATDIDCDECGKPMVIRKGRRGPFLGCSGYPKCRNTGEVPARLMEELGLNGNGKAEPATAAAPPAEVHEDDHGSL